MKAIIHNAFLVFAALLPIVNPLGMAPIFGQMTQGYDVSIRRTVALRVAVNGTVLLVASLFVGSHVLGFFGISLAAVQFGGGLVVAVAGWRILNQEGDLKDSELSSTSDREWILSKAFYPLTLPLTVGPGSISIAITLGSNLHEENRLQILMSSVAATTGIVIIGLITFLCYRFADELHRLLGPTATSIVMRLSAFIVVCIGIQIMFNGMNGFYQHLSAHAATRI